MESKKQFEKEVKKIEYVLMVCTSIPVEEIRDTAIRILNEGVGTVSRFEVAMTGYSPLRVKVKPVKYEK